MPNIRDNYTMMFTTYPDVVNIDQMRAMLGGIGITLAYRLLKKKIIHSIKIGREYKIPKASIIAYLVKNEDE